MNYHYYYFQKECLAKKSRKYFNVNKHYDKQLIDHFFCKRNIEITIYKELELSNIKIYYILYLIWSDITILPEIKKFILNNIDLLLWEIYKKLIKCDLNINT